MHRRRITGKGHKEKENGKIKIEEEEKGGERNVIVHEEKENPYSSLPPPYPLSLFPSSLRHVYIHNYLQKKNISKVKNVCAKVKSFFRAFLEEKVVKTVTSSC